MIGGSVLLAGLLLIVTSLVSRWMPGDAIFTSSGSGASAVVGTGWVARARRAQTPIGAFVLSPIHPATWSANLAIFRGFWIGIISFTALVGVFSAGAGLLAVGVGIVLVGVAIEMCRVIARVERRRATAVDSRPLQAHQYKDLRGGRGDFKQIVTAEFADEARWRDVIYVVVNFPLAILEFSAALVVWLPALWLASSLVWFDLIPTASAPQYFEWLFVRSDFSAVIRIAAGLLLLPFAASASQGLMVLQRAVVSGLLCASEQRELQRRVETLTQSRQAALGVEASELRRIERDLHDGAQQRLVMLTIDLSLAGDRIETDPTAARKLVDDARDQARQALAELRDLVRGIAPAILLDRGLPAALGSIAGRCTVPTVVQTNLPPGERLPEAIERAAYFVVAEALANVAKHSGGTQCEVRCFRDAYWLIVEIWDNGKGGATVSPGSGLEGLQGRVAALDGRFLYSSPAGGPTVLRAEFPAPPRQAPETQPARAYAAGMARGSEQPPAALPPFASAGVPRPAAPSETAASEMPAQEPR